MARWNNPAPAPDDNLWRLEIPLFGSRGVPIGRLTVAGHRDDDQPLTETLLTLTKIVETAELRAAEVTAPKAEPATPQPPAEDKDAVATGV